MHSSDSQHLIAPSLQLVLCTDEHASICQFIVFTQVDRVEQ